MSERTTKPDETALRESLTQKLAEIGIGPDGQESLHSWRCADKVRYPGPCGCVPELVDDLVAGVREHVAELMRENATLKAVQQAVSECRDDPASVVVKSDRLLGEAVIERHRVETKLIEVTRLVDEHLPRVFLALNTAIATDKPKSDLTEGELAAREANSALHWFFKKFTRAANPGGTDV